MANEVTLRQFYQKMNQFRGDYAVNDFDEFAELLCECADFARVCGELSDDQRELVGVPKTDLLAEFAECLSRCAEIAEALYNFEV